MNDTPIAGCSVFINSTSRGTVTNSKGEFELQNLPEGKYELVISSIGYETFVYDFNSTQLPLRLQITLKQKATELTEVTVEPFEKNGWQKWGKTFTDNFIGKTDNASNCTIKNYKVIHFRFSKKNNKLIAQADEPLIIENKALGYIIKYQLEDFYCDFEKHVTLYLGYPLFKQMEGSPKKQLRWQEQRKKIYYGSMSHFVKSLYHGQLKGQGFEVVKTIKEPNIEKQRVKNLYKSMVSAADTFQLEKNGSVTKTNIPKTISKDSVVYYSSVLNKPDSFTQYINLTADSLVTVNNDSVKSIFFTGTLLVIYTNVKDKWNSQSYIYLATPAPVFIEKNGAYDPPEELIASGYWGYFEKVANELPLDFSIDKDFVDDSY